MAHRSFLLINPPMDYSLLRKEFSMEAYLPPLGLLYIARQLEKLGQSVTVVDYIAEQFTEDKLKMLLEHADIVGITITSQIASSAQKIVEFIKLNHPNLLVILGGPHCTLQGTHVLQEINADVAVIGDGEHTIGEILDVLEGKKTYADVHGIVYRKDGDIHAGLPRCDIEDLDSIDFPSRHLTAQYAYGKRQIAGVTFFAKGKITSMVTTRGCPFHCRFCVSKSIFSTYRSRSPENVIRELEEIAKDYDSVFIVDDNFLLNKKHAEKIMDFLIQKKLGIEIWIAGVRVTDADPALFQKMKKAGVKSIEFGIESGNQEVLDYYDKKITLDTIRRAVKLSKKTGFLTIGNFIVGAPLETERHIEDTIQFAKELNLDFAFFYPFMYLKGSALWDDAVQKGLLSENELFVMNNSRAGLGNFTLEEFRNTITEAYRRFYFTPRYLVSQLLRQLFVYHNFRVFQAGLKLFLEQKDDSVFDYMSS
ncbi:MAG: B12-binding domain-containing radical SAM protein [Candidatus Thermoplasmatota archaeon]|nr:B12-binding domain-containing radical SAM protein [Candidatus Thermoplasmatota archaeon]